MRYVYTGRNNVARPAPGYQQPVLLAKQAETSTRTSLEERIGMRAPSKTNLEPSVNDGANHGAH
jgi:hypothetical protein